MNASFISTSTITSASRLSIMKLQAKLAEAQKEVASGHHADVGLTLGYQAGQSVTLRQELSRLQTITDTNGTVTTRLDSSQAALKSIADDAQTFLNQLLAARDGSAGADVIAQQGKAGLSAFTDAINTSVDGAYLFSGVNADVRPLNAYFQNPPSAAQDAVAGAFQAAFGMAPSDPGVAGISAGDMQAFLQGSFADLTGDPAWNANWSGASDQNVKSRISSSEVIDTSTNANEPAFRKLAGAYAMVAGLNLEGLSGDAYKTVIDQATRDVGDALAGISRCRRHSARPRSGSPAQTTACRSRSTSSMSISAPSRASIRPRPPRE